jgi:hypothetical protein
MGVRLDDAPEFIIAQILVALASTVLYPWLISQTAVIRFVRQIVYFLFVRYRTEQLHFDW